MANACTEEVTIPADELARLRRDSKILDLLERERRICQPKAKPWRRLVGDLVDTEESIEAIVEGAVKRREARRAAAARPDPTLDRSRAG